MRRTIRTMLAAAVVAAGLVTATAALPTAAGAAEIPSTTSLSTKAYSKSALAALPTCNNWSKFRYDTTPYFVLIPSVGNDTYATDCRLFNGVYDNTAVWVLQWALNQCYNQRLPHDSDYGTDTRSSVINVQTFHRFDPRDIDGVYGPQTASMMAWPKTNAAGAYVGCWF